MVQMMEQAYEEQMKKKLFDPKEHLIQIKSGQKTSDYLPVNWRLDEVWGQPDLLATRSLYAQEALRLSGNPYVEKYVARFLERVEVDNHGCWLWTSTLNNKGYARMGMYSRLVLMHRWSYLLFHGAIPQQLELDHLCSNPRCVNPDHLDPVTHKENNLRGKGLAIENARKTHCPKGHPYNAENTSRTRGRGRACKTCKREKSRPYAKLIAEQLTHCPKGHLYDAENTGITKNGRRYCKVCSKVQTPTFYIRQAKGRAV